MVDAFCDNGHKPVLIPPDYLRLWWQCPVCGKILTREEVYLVMEKVSKN